jgi:hypothetical protein
VNPVPRTIAGHLKQGGPIKRPKLTPARGPGTRQEIASMTWYPVTIEGLQNISFGKSKNNQEISMGGTCLIIDGAASSVTKRHHDVTISLLTVQFSTGFFQKELSIVYTGILPICHMNNR